MLKNKYFWIALSWTLLLTFLCLVEKREIPNVAIPNLDKAVHVFFHFSLTLLWFLFFNATKNTKALYLSVVISVVFGVLIEIIQEFYTKTRSADSADVLSNCIGTMLAALSIYSWKKKKQL